MREEQGRRRGFHRRRPAGMRVAHRPPDGLGNCGPDHRVFSHRFAPYVVTMSMIRSTMERAHMVAKGGIKLPGRFWTLSP